jgi:hypothetical protein
VNLIPIKVETHAGYKTNEYPTAVTIDQNRYEITEIIDRWYQYDIDSDMPPANYFKVMISTDQYLVIKHIKNTDDWFLVE